MSPDMGTADARPFPVFQSVDVACPEMDGKPKRLILSSSPLSPSPSF